MFTKAQGYRTLKNGCKAEQSEVELLDGWIPGKDLGYLLAPRLLETRLIN